MAFCDAFFDGDAVLEGVQAHLAADIPELAAVLDGRERVPVVSLELPRILEALRPGILVDARMRKHQHPEVQIGLAPLTIGLGPNFTAGITVRAAVETGWNDALGYVLWEGATRPLEGEPQKIAGHARDRYVYAPAAGVFHTSLAIGDAVAAGQEVARIDGVPLHANIAGSLRGLTHDGAPVAEKAKVIEVDPRGPRAQVRGIGERPGRIARGVLEAVRAWESGL